MGDTSCTRRWTARLLLSFTVALGVSAGVRPARAADRSEPLAPCGTAGPESLDLALVDVDEPALLRAAICDWFRDEPWRVRFDRAATPSVPSVPSAALGLRVTVRVVSDVELELELATGAGAPTGVERWRRSLALVRGLDAAHAEMVAQVLHSTAQAFGQARLTATREPAAPEWTRVARAASSGGGIGAVEPPRDEARATEPQSAPSSVAAPVRAPQRARPRPTTAPALHVRTGLAHQAYLRGDEPLTHGPLLRIDVDVLRRPLRAAAFLQTGVFTSSFAGAGGIDVRLTGATLAAGLTGAAAFEGTASGSEAGLAARWGVGMGLELLELETRVWDPSELRVVAARQPRARPSLLFEAGLAWRSGPWELSGLAIARWQLLASHYQVQRGEAADSVLRPWRLQPGASLGAAYVW